MAGSAASIDEFKETLRSELARMASNRRREYIEARLIEPSVVTLQWEYGNDEPFAAWMFADLRRAGVMVVYCTGGFGALGAPWGLHLRSSTHFGQDSGWFRTLSALAEDEGVPA
jgi:hypothetical protein